MIIIDFASLSWLFWLLIGGIAVIVVFLALDRGKEEETKAGPSGRDKPRSNSF